MVHPFFLFLFFILLCKSKLQIYLMGANPSNEERSTELSVQLKLTKDLYQKEQWEPLLHNTPQIATLMFNKRETVAISRPSILNFEFSNIKAPCTPVVLKHPSVQESQLSFTSIFLTFKHLN